VDREGDRRGRRCHRSEKKKNRDTLAIERLYREALIPYNNNNNNKAFNPK
jgi:hypothetical protein